jgi:hypothetical protein
VSSPETSADQQRVPAAGPADLDVRGARRLAGKEEWFWYLFAAVTYIACGIWQKFLLNWIIGPLWLVAVVVIGPAVWDRVRGRRPGADTS